MYNAKIIKFLDDHEIQMASDMAISLYWFIYFLF